MFMIGHYKDPHEPIITMECHVRLLLSIRHRLGMTSKNQVDALESQDTTALIVALLAGALGAFIVSWCALTDVDGNFVGLVKSGGRELFLCDRFLMLVFLLVGMAEQFSGKHTVILKFRCSNRCVVGR